MSLSELKEALRFSIQSDGLILDCPENMTEFLYKVLPRTVEIRILPTVLSTLTANGDYIRTTVTIEHAAIRSDAVRSWLKGLPSSHFMHFGQNDGHIKLAEICLQYISYMLGYEDLSDVEVIECGVEHVLLRYALESLPVHCSRAPHNLFADLAKSSLFDNPALTKVLRRLVPAAARRGDLSMLAILIKTVDPNARETNFGSHTALSYAVINGNLKMVDALLTHPKIEVDLLIRGYTALHLALQAEQFEVARLLMSKGRANPGLCEVHGWDAIRILLRTSGYTSKYEPDQLHGLTKSVCQEHTEADESRRGDTDN